MYMLCVTGSVDCLWGMCVLKGKINCGYLRVFYVQLKGISIIRKCSVVCQWITGLHWMQDYPGWQAFVEDRTSLEYTMSCISLHLGKNYGAVCITGSLDTHTKKWRGGGPADLHKSKAPPTPPHPPPTYIKVKTPPPLPDLHKRKVYSLLCHWITGLCWRRGSLEGKPLQKGRPAWRTGQGIKGGKSLLE